MLVCWEIYSGQAYFSLNRHSTKKVRRFVGFQRGNRGGSRIFFRKGCTRLLLYFNTNKPHSFFWQNTSCIRKPQVISGGRGGGVGTPCILPLDPLLGKDNFDKPLEFFRHPRISMILSFINSFTI